MLVVGGYYDLSGGSEANNRVTTLGQYMQHFQVPSLIAD